MVHSAASGSVPTEQTDNSVPEWQRARVADLAADFMGTVRPIQRRVVAAAHLYLLAGDEDPRAVPTIVSAPSPARHHNLFALVGGRRPDDSGFLLDDGSFATREEAAVIALAAGQTTPERMTVPGKLFSEDMW